MYPRGKPQTVAVAPVMIFVKGAMFLCSFQHLMKGVVLMFYLNLHRVIPHGNFRDAYSIYRTYHNDCFFLQERLFLVTKRNNRPTST